MKDNRKILIYRLGSLGDTVMVVPCFNKIKATFPGAQLMLLTNKPVNTKVPSILSVVGQGFFARVFEYPLGMRNPVSIIKHILELRKEKIDTVINLAAARSKRSTRRDKLFFRLAGIKKQVGTPQNDPDFDPSAGMPAGVYKWEAQRLADRIACLGELNLEEAGYWDLHFTQEEHDKVRFFLEKVNNRPYIVLSPGTKMQSKDWGRENWLHLIRKMNIQFLSYTLILVGAPVERDLAQACLQAWEGEGVNACGVLSPRESAVLLSKARIFIGHDSGPMHLAGAVLTPVVAIFSARNIPVQWFPRGDNNSIIYHKTGCAGCNLEVCIENKKKCILSVSVDEVFAAVHQKLKFIESKSF